MRAPAHRDFIGPARAGDRDSSSNQVSETPCGPAVTPAQSLKRTVPLLRAAASVSASSGSLGCELLSRFCGLDVQFTALHGHRQAKLSNQIR